MSHRNRIFHLWKGFVYTHYRMFINNDELASYTSHEYKNNKVWTKSPKCIIVLKDMQPFVNISFVELIKVKQLMKLIFWIFKIGSKWNKFNHINALQQHEKLIFGDFAFRFSLHWRTSCKTKVKSIFFISFVMPVLDQEPGVSEILSKINGVIVSWMPLWTPIH